MSNRSSCRLDTEGKSHRISMTSLEAVEGALVDRSPAILVNYKSNTELSPTKWAAAKNKLNEVNGHGDSNNKLTNGHHFNKNDFTSPIKNDDTQMLIEEELNCTLPGSVPETVENKDLSVSSPMSQFGTFDKEIPEAGKMREIVTRIKEENYVDPYVPKHQNGPDCMIESNDLCCWHPEGAVRLRIGPTGMGSAPPISVVTLITREAGKIPDAIMMGVKREGKWLKWTYKQLLHDVRLVARGLMKLGLQPFHGVGIIGFNSPEWAIADFAAIFAGGFATGIYTTNSPEACWHVLSDSRSNICIVEDKKQLDKILEIRHKLPDLKHIVQYMGEVTHPDVLGWSDLYEIGATVSEEALDRRIKGIAVNQCCTLIYTSGTTGNSKGVMLSHDNLTFNAAIVADMSQVTYGDERVVSYLPLSHVAAQMLDLYICITAGGSTYFAQPDALKGSLKDTLLEIEPTRVLGVPRVWEKMYASVSEKEKSMGFVGRKLFAFARRVGTQLSNMRNNGSTAYPFGYSVANIIFKKVRGAIGFSQARHFISGAAPISKEIVEYFHSLNIQIQEMYGLSETTAPHCANFNFRTRVGSVGRTMHYLETKLDKKDPETEVGEICMRGRNVFMGYLNMQAMTLESIDAEGWLHSGDLGKIDDDQYLHITGRLKEILITAGGENVAPVPIEEKIKKELPCISNAMIVGDRKKFLSVILTFLTEIDLDTASPTDNLLPGAKDWLRGVGCNASTVSAVLDSQNNAVMAAIQKGIDRVNQQAISNAQKIQKWVIIPKDFSIPGGELGPTLKLKRPAVVEKYADVIAKIYAEDPVQ